MWILAFADQEPELRRSHPDAAHPEREIMMHLNEAADRATAVADLYDRLNLQQRGRTWSRQDFVLGFVGDVGDLAKLTMAAEGTRHIPGDIKAQLEHELADCLFSVLVIARLYDVDLESAFTRTMEVLTSSISNQLEGVPG